MLDLQMIGKIIRGCDHPPIRNLRDGSHEDFPAEGLTMGNLWLGKQGSGKTTALARHRVEYDIAHPKDASFSLDRSGSYTDDYLSIAMTSHEWPRLRRRIKYVRLGDPRWTVPFPEFSPLYGNTPEEQVQRVSSTFIRLMDHAENKAVIVAGGALRSMLPHFCRLAVAMANVRTPREPLQLTEIPYLIEDSRLLEKALSEVEKNLAEASRMFLRIRFIEKKDHEREFRTYALTEVFSALGVDAGSAALGWHRPNWTPKEAMEKGWIVLVDGSRLAGNKPLQDYLLTQFYGFVMEQVVSRIPHDERNNYVALVIDEVRSWLKIPGMAEDVGEISQLYRSRKVQLYLVVQSIVGQLDPVLQENIWGLGNRIIFSLTNKNDCSMAAYQMGMYDPRMVKQFAKTDSQNNITEPEKGQDRTIADWIWGMDHRECIFQRYHSEKRQDPFTWHISQTKGASLMTDRSILEETKDELLREYAVPVNDAIAAVSARLEELKNAPKKQKNKDGPGPVNANS